MSVVAKTKYYPGHQSYLTKLFQNDATIGFCQWAPMEIDSVKIEFVYISPEFRNQGYGSMMMKIVAKEISRMEAVQWIYLDETLDGGRDNTFFQNLGFQYVADDNEMRAARSDFLSD